MPCKTYKRKSSMSNNHKTSRKSKRSIKHKSHSFRNKKTRSFVKKMRGGGVEVDNLYIEISDDDGELYFVHVNSIKDETASCLTGHFPFKIPFNSFSETPGYYKSNYEVDELVEDIILTEIETLDLVGNLKLVGQNIHNALDEIVKFINVNVIKNPKYKTQIINLIAIQQKLKEKERIEERNRIKQEEQRQEEKNLKYIENRNKLAVSIIQTNIDEIQTNADSVLLTFNRKNEQFMKLVESESKPDNITTLLQKAVIADISNNKITNLTRLERNILNTYFDIPELFNNGLSKEDENLNIEAFKMIQCISRNFELEQFKLQKRKQLHPNFELVNYIKSLIIKPGQTEYFFRLDCHSIIPNVSKLFIKLDLSNNETKIYGTFDKELNNLIQII